MPDKKEVDHDKALCGKPNVPNNIPLEDLEKRPAHCLCCGSEMVVQKPESVSMQQLGIFCLVCPICSSSKATTN